MARAKKAVIKRAEPREARDYYRQELDALPPPIPAEEESRLMVRIRQNDQDAMDELLKRNLRFVVSEANKYRYSKVDMEDIIAAGNYGLVKAVGKFDETRGVKFISYATWWVRNAIHEELARQGGHTRLPQGAKTFYNAVLRHEQRFFSETSSPEKAHKLAVEAVAQKYLQNKMQEYMRARGCSEDEARAHIYTPDRQRQAVAAVQQYCDLVERAFSGRSIDEPLDNRSNATGHDTLESRVESAENAVEQKFVQAEISRALKQIKPNDATVIRRYFGLEGERGRTLEQIGKEMGITRERCRQLRDRGLRDIGEQFPYLADSLSAYDSDAA